MILTCPTCASRYRIDETKLGAKGRTVRCAGCGESWRAEPLSEPLHLTPDHLTPDVQDPAHEPEAAVLATKPEADLAQAPAQELPKVFRQKADAKRRTREALTAGLVWGAMTVSLGLLLLGAVVFRVQVVRLWPRTAGAYAAVRLPVNPLGVAPENVQAAAGLENGRAALIVTGAERNIDSRPRGPAPLLISVYDKAGVRLLSRTVNLSAAALNGGESRPFRVSFLDPPMAAAQVGVDFAPPSPAPAPPTKAPRLRGALSPSSEVRLSEAQAAAWRTPAPRLRGEIPPADGAGTAIAPLPPIAARPIPASSPYALPSAARSQTE